MISETEYKVSDVADVQVGLVIKPTRFYSDVPTPYPAFRSLNVGSMEVRDSDWIYFTEKGMEENQRTIAHTGDVLVVRSGYPGTSCVVTPEYDGRNVVDLIIAHPDTSKILPEFLCAYTNFPHGKMQIEANQRGVAQKHFNVSLYNSMKIVVPDLDKQHEFVKILKQSDKSKFNGFKSQFIEMFGDPVDNPMGWDTVPLLELGKCKNGMNFRSKDSGYEIHCLGVADFKDNDVLNDSNELPMISLNEAPSEEYLLADGDIVFVRSNGNKTLVGRTVMVFPGGTPTTYSGFCIRFRKNDSRIETGYLLRILKMDSVRQKMAGRGANIQNLNQQILSQLNILLPPIDLQEKYLEFVQQSDKSKEIQYLDISSIDNSSKTVTGLTTSVAREWKMAQKPVMHQLFKKQSCSKRR